MRKAAPRITQTKHIVTLLQELQYKGQFNINTILDWLLNKLQAKGEIFKTIGEMIKEAMDTFKLDFNEKLQSAITLAENLLINTKAKRISNITFNKGYIEGNMA